MRNFIWIFILLAACQNLSNEHVNITSIEFEYIGNSDKPFTSLFMTTEKEQLRNEPFVKSILASEETLQFIENFLKNNNSLLFQKNKSDYIKNIGFKITTDNDKFVFVGRKEAVILFRKLSNELISNNKLNKREVSLINEYLEITILRMDW
jgi:hypothetical protein